MYPIFASLGFIPLMGMLYYMVKRDTYNIHICTIILDVFSCSGQHQRLYERRYRKGSRHSRYCHLGTHFLALVIEPHDRHT